MPQHTSMPSPLRITHTSKATFAAPQCNTLSYNRSKMAPQCDTHTGIATTPLHHSDIDTMSRYTTTIDSNRNTAFFADTTPLAPMILPPPGTFLPPHRSACTLLWVEDLESGDTFDIESGPDTHCTTSTAQEFTTPSP
ncbi:hypothetical protein Pcinc_002874 [Petrolisthes cinctipes]|uniref:Uncharacterized protein n=1 Tax=Petrolisthes cinctipes TaxID=88211 RepID=A0AAE1L1V4_PETCI|nr:hypothetical protein Pcinc_002874 [Petrolisthes cinctipes]